MPIDGGPKNWLVENWFGGKMFVGVKIPFDDPPNDELTPNDPEPTLTPGGPYTWAGTDCGGP